MEITKKKDMIYIVGMKCCICDRELTKEYIQKHGAHDGRDSAGNLTSMMCHDCFIKYEL